MKPIIQIWLFALPISFAVATFYPPELRIKTAYVKRVASQNSRIAFLTFSISKTPDDKPTIELLDKILVEGVLKNDGFHLKRGRHGDLACMVLDDNSKSQKIQFISNPLKKSVEYVNSSGEFQRKEVISENTQFSIRLQLNTNSKYIIIKQVDTLSNQYPVLFRSAID